MADDPLLAELVRVLPYSTIPTEDDARAVLDFIAETRRLLPAGGAVVVATTEAAEGFTERVEWGVRYSDLHPEPVRCLDEGTARRAAEVAGRTLMRRNAYTGPWEPVTEPEAGRA